MSEQVKIPDEFLVDGEFWGLSWNQQVAALQRIARSEQALAALEAENKRLRNPVTLTDTLTHSRTCSAGYDLDSDCTCGLDYRVQLQTSQTLHAAWIKRASEAEQQVAALEAQLAAMTVDRNLWQESHDEDCPNKARVEALESVLPKGA